MHADRRWNRSTRVRLIQLGLAMTGIAFAVRTPDPCEAADDLPLKSASLADLQKTQRLRETIIHTIDFTVKYEIVKAIDHDRYFVDSQAYNDDVAKFFGVSSAKQPGVPANGVDPIRYLRFRQNADGHIRIDELTGPPEDGGYSAVASECFLGQRWERKVRIPPNRVHISDAPLALRLLSVLGLQVPEVRRNDLSGPLSALLNANDREDGAMRVDARDVGDLVTATVWVPRSKLEDDWTHYERLTFDFDRKRKYLPLRFLSESLVQRTDGTILQGRIQGKGLRAEWSDHQNATPLLILPRRLDVVEYVTLARPLHSNGFRAWQLDGKPVQVNGAPAIDMTRATLTHYDVNFHRFLVDPLIVNEEIKEPLGNERYPAGTIVQDEATNEVFELLDEGPAVGDVRKRILSPGRPVPRKR